MQSLPESDSLRRQRIVAQSILGGFVVLFIGGMIAFWQVSQKWNERERERERLAHAFYSSSSRQGVWDCLDDDRNRGLSLHQPPPSERVVILGVLVHETPAPDYLINAARHERVVVHASSSGGSRVLVYTRDGRALRRGELAHLQECLNVDWDSR